MRPFLFVLCLLSFPLSAATRLVGDLRTRPDGIGDSQVFYLETAGGAAVFVAQQGMETGLWRTDGTEAGTYKLLALMPAEASELAVWGAFLHQSVLYFGVETGSGHRIWRTDGTVAGTISITLPTQAFQAPLATIGSRIYYLTNGYSELWVYDGTTSRKLVTIRTDRPRWHSYVTFGDNFYLGTESGLLKSDGTESGTTKISTVQAFGLNVAGNRIVFAGNDGGTAGGELWTSDGTAAGTQLLLDLRADGSTFVSGRSRLEPLGSGLFFIGANGELGTTDGTAAGTRILRTGAAPKTSSTVTVLNGVAYFPHDDGIHGRELWRSDGTEAGTRLVRDASDSDQGIHWISAGETRVHYYARERGRPALELFQSDGTEAGTRVVHSPGGAWKGSSSAYPYLLTRGDTVFYAADDGTHGTEPWVFDGTSARMIANVAPETPGSSNPQNLLAAADRLFFNARGDDSNASPVWSTDGGAPVILGHGTPLAANGNTVYSRSGRAQLWRSDGPGREVLVKDFDQGFNTPEVKDVKVIGGRVYVRADDGRETRLYVTDGTPAGTKAVTDGGVSEIFDLAGRAYFWSNGALFTTDGTYASTRTVARIPGEFVRAIAGPVAFGGALYVFARLDDDAFLWKFTGGPNEVTLVAELPFASYEPRVHVAAAGTSLLFTWRADGIHGNQLWKTDGTAAGTTMLREFSLGLTSFTPLVSLGQRVVFGVDDGTRGVEPWVSDGTPEGTLLLRDVSGVAPGSSPSDFAVANGVAYFAAKDELTGRELWRTDGTPQGTHLAADIHPGTPWSAPAGMSPVGNTLYFAATDPAFGRELLAYDLTDPAAIAIDDVRVRESAGTATLTVRLTRPSTAAITVGYESPNANGTLVFDAGQTVKTIVFPIADDSTAGPTRTFTVRLKDANAPIARVLGAVIVEDDDARTDVSVSLLPDAGSFGRARFRVTNLGPSAATNVQLCAAAPPRDPEFECKPRFELAAGASLDFTLNAPTDTGAIVARVTQWETDTNQANNEALWLTSGVGSYALYATPATPRVGETGTLVVTNGIAVASTVVLQSSDPSVIPVPASVEVPANGTATVNFTALKAGTARITATIRSNPYSVTLRAIGATETRRMPATLELFNPSPLTFGVAKLVLATIRGTAPDGGQPTGTVTFAEDGRVLGTAAVVNGQALFRVTTQTPGNHRYTATYSGDARFLDAVSEANVFVFKGTPSFRARPVAGSANVLVTLTGMGGVPPTGTVNGVTLDASSSATLTGIAAGARTITIAYSGDANYITTTVTIPLAYGKQRSTR